MNRIFIALVSLMTLPFVGVSQQSMNIESFQPPLKYDNIHTYEIDSDSNVSTFLVWIKDHVKAHKHQKHSEIVYVLQGQGELTLEINGEPKTSVVRSGDYIFIPDNTVHSVKVVGNAPMKVLSVQTPYFDGSDRVLTNN